MARQLKITDGTNSVDLLDTAVWGLLEWQPSDPSEADIRRESVYDEGSALISSEPRNVIETLKTRLVGASHNDISTTMQTLATLKQEAKQWHTTNWQKTPVYLTAQASGESNPRYALVYKIRWAWQRSPYGKTFEQQLNMHLVLIVEREPYWRNNIPLTVPTALTLGAPSAPSPQIDATEQFIANFSDTLDITHCYNYDDSAAAFSANNLTSFTFFVVSGSTPALSDIVYFGSTQGGFRHIVLSIGIPISASVTLTWEIWTGAAWTASRVAQSSPFGTAGAQLITVENPTGWAATTINGVSAYWVRCRISAFTSWTTSPTQGAQVLYSPRDPYITIGSTIINGDVDALALIRYFAKRSTTLGINLIAIGLKSRGLTTFRSRLNAISPGGNWQSFLGTDTTSVSDPHAPGGLNATCTFLTATTSNVIWQNSTSAELLDCEGEYNCYVRCQQVGGAAGAAKLRLTQIVPENSSTPVWSPLQSTGVMEYINLGRLALQPARAFSGDAGAALISLQLDFTVPSDTCDLIIYDLILIPVDEWSFVAVSVQTDLSTVGDSLAMDAGLIRQGTIKKITSEGIYSIFQSRGRLPRLPPDKALQLHFLLGAYGSSINRADGYLGGSIKIYTHERFEGLRGSE